MINLFKGAGSLNIESIFNAGFWAVGTSSYSSAIILLLGGNVFIGICMGIISITVLFLLRLEKKMRATRDDIHKDLQEMQDISDDIADMLLNADARHTVKIKKMFPNISIH